MIISCFKSAIRKINKLVGVLFFFLIPNFLALLDVLPVDSASTSGGCENRLDICLFMLFADN